MGIDQFSPWQINMDHKINYISVLSIWCFVSLHHAEHKESEMRSNIIGDSAILMQMNE